MLARSYGNPTRSSRIPFASGDWPISATVVLSRSHAPGTTWLTNVVLRQFHGECQGHAQSAHLRRADVAQSVRP